MKISSSLSHHETNRFFFGLICRPRQRRPDRAVYVPRGRRSQTTPPTAAANLLASPKQQQQHQSETINQLLDLPTISSKQTIAIPSSPTTIPAVENRFSDSTGRSNSLADPVNYYCDALNQTSNNNCVNIIPYDRSAHVDDSSDGGDNSDENNHRDENKQVQQIIHDKMQKARANGTSANVAVSNDKDYNEEKEFQRASKVIIYRLMPHYTLFTRTTI